MSHINESQKCIIYKMTHFWCLYGGINLEYLAPFEWRLWWAINVSHQGLLIAHGQSYPGLEYDSLLWVI